MAELEETGLLERADGRGRYVVGPRLRSLARAALHDPMLAEQAQSVLDGLRDRSGETVSLHVRREDSRVCIAHAESQHSVRRVVPIGATVPLHVGATGAMLLRGPAARRARRLPDHGRPGRRRARGAGGPSGRGPA